MSLGILREVLCVFTADNGCWILNAIFRRVLHIFRNFVLICILTYS